MSTPVIIWAIFLFVAGLTVCGFLYMFIKYIGKHPPDEEPGIAKMISQQQKIIDLLETMARKQVTIVPKNNKNRKKKD